MQDASLLFRAVVGGGGVKLIALAGRVGLQLIAQIAVECALDIWKDSDNLLITWETVAMETPAFAAISLMVIKLPLAGTDLVRLFLRGWI